MHMTKTTCCQHDCFPWRKKGETLVCFILGTIMVPPLYILMAVIHTYTSLHKLLYSFEWQDFEYAPNQSNLASTMYQSDSLHHLTFHKQTLKGRYKQK